MNKLSKDQDRTSSWCHAEVAPTQPGQPHARTVGADDRLDPKVNRGANENAMT